MLVGKFCPEWVEEPVSVGIVPCRTGGPEAVYRAFPCISWFVFYNSYFTAYTAKLFKT